MRITVTDATDLCMLHSLNILEETILPCDLIRPADKEHTVTEHVNVVFQICSPKLDYMELLYFEYGLMPPLFTCSFLRPVYLLLSKLCFEFIWLIQFRLGPNMWWFIYEDNGLVMKRQIHWFQHLKINESTTKISIIVNSWKGIFMNNFFWWGVGVSVDVKIKVLPWKVVDFLKLCKCPECVWFQVRASPH